MGVKDLQDLKKISMLRSQIDAKGIEEIMDTDFPTVEPDDRLIDALSLMRKTGYQDLPVIEDGEFIGAVNYGAILKKKNASLDSKIRNVMGTMPALSRDMKLTEAAELMVMNNSRQLPVVNGNRRKILGMVTRSHLISVAGGIKAFKEIKVWEIMTSPVESILGRQLLDDAVDIMKGLDVRTVPVVNDANHVTGIVGMREVIDSNWRGDVKTMADLSGRGRERSEATVESVCNSAVKTVDWDDSLEEAVATMTEFGISTLPVLEEGKLVGIITHYDILELMSACKQRDFLFVQISGLDDVDKAYTGAIYASVEDQVAKVTKVAKPESLTMHVSKYKEKGDRNKYSISARLIVDGGAFGAKEVGWDLPKTADDLMKKIAASVLSDKDAKDTFRRRKR